MIFAATDNWLKAVGDDPREWHSLYPLGRLTLTDAQAALDAQYGKGAFRAAMHGTSMSIYNYDVKRSQLLARWGKYDDAKIGECRGKFTPGGFHERVLNEELARRGLSEES